MATMETLLSIFGHYNQNSTINGINGIGMNENETCFQQPMDQKMFFQNQSFDPNKNRNKGKGFNNNNGSKPRCQIYGELGTLLDHVDIDSII